jgi:hypothetical protein
VSYFHVNILSYAHFIHGHLHTSFDCVNCVFSISALSCI